MTTSSSYRPTQESENGGGSGGSVGQLLGEIGGDLSTLMRQELELAKAEMRQSATQAAKGGGMLSGAAVGAHMVLLFLSIALWWGLSNMNDASLGLGWSALIVAAIWTVIAAGLGAAGRSQLKRVTGLPKTAETAKKIPEAIKGNEDGR